jgi:hypothetical protein
LKIVQAYAGFYRNLILAEYDAEMAKKRRLPALVAPTVFGIENKIFSFREHRVMLDRKVGKHDAGLKTILKILHKLLDPPLLPQKRSMGFLTGEEK